MNCVMTDNALIRIRRILEWLAASLLAVTGILKIASAFGSDRIMTLSDPILRLNNQVLYLSVGCIEIMLAAYLIFSTNAYLKVLSLVWLLLCFAAYRVGWVLADVGEPCPCLGTGFTWWPWLGTHIKTLSTAAFIAFAAVTLLRALAQIKPKQKPQTV